MKLSDFNWDMLPVHTTIEGKLSDGYGVHNLMWRGYGRFTNLTTGTEWFVKDSQADFDWFEVPSFVIGG